MVFKAIPVPKMPGANFARAPFCPPYLSDSSGPWKMAVASIYPHRHFSLLSNADGIPMKSWRTRGRGSADSLDEGHHHHQRACSAPWSEGAHRDLVFPSLSLGTGSGLKLGKGWGRNLPRNTSPRVRSAHTKRAQ